MASVDPEVGHFRLPADRRSTPRPGPFDAPDPIVQVLLEAIVRGDIDALYLLLTGSARGLLLHLVASRGREALSASLQRQSRTLLDCRLERRLEVVGGVIECRLRLFSLMPGGGVCSSCWVVQARLEGREWRVSGLDRLPGGEECGTDAAGCEVVDSPVPLPP